MRSNCIIRLVNKIYEKSKILDVYKCAKEKSLGNYARRHNL